MNKSAKTIVKILIASYLNGLILGFFVFYLLIMLNTHLGKYGFPGFWSIYIKLGFFYYGPLGLIIFSFAGIILFWPRSHRKSPDFAYISGTLFLFQLLFVIYVYHSNLAKFPSCISPFS